MLKRFINSPISLNKIINYFIILYATVLPLGFAIANIVLALMFLFFIFYFIKNTNALLKNLKQDIKVIILFSTLFWVYAFSLFYSDYFSLGIDEVYKKSPMLIITIFVFVLRTRIKNSTIFKALNMYVYSVTFVSVMSIMLSVYNCYDYQPNILLYCSSDQNLAGAFISYHKLYLALYITIAIFFTLYLIFLKSSKFKIRSIKSVQLLVLFFTLTLLGGRNALFVSSLLIIGFSFFYCLKNNILKKFIVFTVGFFVIISASVYFNPILKEKTKEALNIGNQYSISKRWGGASVRKVIWEHSYLTFKNNPILGVGAGSSQKALNESYSIYTETSAINMTSYNTHNDLFQIAVTTGVLGLLLCIISLILILFKSFKKQNYVHYLFVFLFLVTGLTESLLQRDMGIRVYAFFTILLFILNSQINESSTNTQ